LANFYKRRGGGDDDWEDAEGWEDMDGEDDDGWVDEGPPIVNKKAAAVMIKDAEFVERIEKSLDEKKIVFNKEFLIESDMEMATITRFYCKQTYKILKELYGAKEVLQAAARSQMQIAEQSESDLDDDGELVDQMFGVT
jgi:hypothetical protein